MSRNLHQPGRSPVMSTRAMAATSQPLATATALSILREGGSAIDAAVAAAAMLNVVEPYSTGIGGDCFLLYYHARSDRIYGLNGSGRAGAGADPTMLRADGLRAMPERGARTVTVPGTAAAWTEAIERFGRMPLSWVLQPAIGAAEHGYAVTPVIAGHWQRNRTLLAADPESARVFLPGGRAPEAGGLHRQPDLARTLRQLAEGGAEAFYRGPIGEALVRCVQQGNGFLTADDLRRHRSRWVEPISTRYRGLEVYELPPNGQGLVALLLLNILQQFDLPALRFGSAEHLHRVAEAFRLARAERDAWLGDPDFTEVPVRHLLSSGLAEKLAARVGPTAMREPVRAQTPEHRDTVYLCVVDEKGNAASLVNSLFHAWGAGITVPGTGVALHNRGSSFSLVEGHPNELAPGKRPMHTIIPAMACVDRRPVLVFGVMGGHFQALGHAWVLSAWHDFGLDVQQAVDAPRFFPDAGRLRIERGVSRSVRSALRNLGHDPVVSPDPFGGAQMIAIDRQRGVLTGGSDPRKDGCALGF